MFVGIPSNVGSNRTSKIVIRSFSHYFGVLNVIRSSFVAFVRCVTSVDALFGRWMLFWVLWYRLSVGFESFVGILLCILSFCVLCYVCKYGTLVFCIGYILYVCCELVLYVHCVCLLRVLCCDALCCVLFCCVWCVYWVVNIFHLWCFVSHLLSLVAVVYASVFVDFRWFEALVGIYALIYGTMCFVSCAQWVQCPSTMC